jgi:hypothetical protein
MTGLMHPWYEYEVSVPEELTELVEAFWQSGSDCRASFEFEHDVCLSAPAEGMERFLHHLNELNSPTSPVFRFYIVSRPTILPRQPGEHPDPFGAESSAKPVDHQSSGHHGADVGHRQGRIVSLIVNDLCLPTLTACARWMAGGPKPERREENSLDRCALCGEPSA